MNIPKQLVSYTDRIEKNKHKGCIVWFTGLPRSGKTTLAYQLEKELFDIGYNVMVLDGDIIRTGLSSDLSFSDEDRDENIRRVGHVADLLRQNGTIVLCSFISPKHVHRNLVRMLCPDNFIEVYCNANLDVCQERDYKKLYEAAKIGNITNLTGVGSDYEQPIDPELVIETGLITVSESVGIILKTVFTKIQ
jgi:adenylylsulfate kinase